MMETFYSIKPLAAVLVAILAAIFIVVCGKKPNLRESVTVIAAIAMFSITLSMLPDVLGERYPEIMLWNISPGVSLALRVDAMGIIFGLSASGLWIVTSFYSIGYVRGLDEHKQTRYFASFAICLASAVGVAFSANLLTFIIFYEILTIATYPLVIHKETPESIGGGRKYLVYLLSGGVVLLLALALTYQTAGHADFTAGGILSTGMGHDRVLLLSILFLVGFGVKSAVMPFHSWLPSAMVAPTPVSALLHAVAVVKAGVFGMARAVGFIIGPALLAEIGVSNWLAGFAAATILLASLLAFYQDNLKKRLAYSTIGHLSYIVLGTAILSPAAWTGALLHIVTHAVMKITLFFCAGSIYVKTHVQNISELDGIGKQMPLTMGAFAVASLGLAGVPPISGFISKWFLIQGSVDTGQQVFMWVLLLSGLLNAAYFMPIVIRAFFKPSDKFKKFDEASMMMVVPLVITAVLSVLIGIFPDRFPDFYELASRVAASVVGGMP